MGSGGRGVQGRPDAGEDLGVTSWRGGGDMQGLVAVRVVCFGGRFGVWGEVGLGDLGRSEVETC